MNSKEQFERLNYLSEKALLNNATADDLKEFKQLHEQWQQPHQFNLFSDYNHKG